MMNINVIFIIELTNNAFKTYIVLVVYKSLIYFYFIIACKLHPSLSYINKNNKAKKSNNEYSKNIQCI